MKMILSLVMLLTFGACANREHQPKAPEVPKASVESTSEAKKEVAYGGNCGMGLCHKKMVKGDPQYNFEYKGKIYHFSSAKAREQFIAKIDENIKKADKQWETSAESASRL